MPGMVWHGGEIDLIAKASAAYCSRITNLCRELAV